MEIVETIASQLQQYYVRHYGFSQNRYLLLSIYIDYVSETLVQAIYLRGCLGYSKF